MSAYISQTITVSSCQSDISNRCRIKTPCITGMADTSNPPLAGWRRQREGGGAETQGSVAQEVLNKTFTTQFGGIEVVMHLELPPQEL